MLPLARSFPVMIRSTPPTLILSSTSIIFSPMVKKSNSQLFTIINDWNCATTEQSLVDIDLAISRLKVKIKKTDDSILKEVSPPPPKLFNTAFEFKLRRVFVGAFAESRWRQRKKGFSRCQAHHTSKTQSSYHTKLHMACINRVL